MATLAGAQAGPAERVFAQSKSDIEKALKSMQSTLAGRLPTLDGFVQPDERSLDRYQRGYYQANIQVTSTPSGGAVVRVSAKLTAWYNDPMGTQSGYRSLVSNGRIEEDLLGQLTDQIAALAAAQPKVQHGTAQIAKPAAMAGAPASNSVASTSPQPTPHASVPPAAKSSQTEQALANAPDPNSPFSTSTSHELPVPERAQPDAANAASEKVDPSLQEEADSLEEILKNQAHPKDLVAVKKSGTPVIATPSLTAKPLFLASMHDEFELLDFNADWVHVRISGLSRGWIWRNSVEMPEGIADSDVKTAPALVAAEDLFKVFREETSSFPGDWEPLRSKNVKILTVQEVDAKSKPAGGKDRLEYAKFLFDKNFAEINKATAPLAGIVVIFDSADGGMIAATSSTLRQWKAGKLSDAALWHSCFFDPPETFNSDGIAGSQ
jgi:hypothetical protein